MGINMKPLKDKKPFMSFMVFTLVTPFMSFMPINYDLHKRCHSVPFMLEMCQPSYLESNHKRITAITEYRYFSLFSINGEEMMPFMDPKEHQVSTEALPRHQGNLEGDLTNWEPTFLHRYLFERGKPNNYHILISYMKYSNS